MDGNFVRAYELCEYFHGSRLVVRGRGQVKTCLLGSGARQHDFVAGATVAQRAVLFRIPFKNSLIVSHNYGPQIIGGPEDPMS